MPVLVVRVKIIFFFTFDPKHTFVFLSPKPNKSGRYAGIDIQFDANDEYGRIGKIPSSKCVLPAKIIIPPHNRQLTIQVLPRFDLPTDQQASPAIYIDRQRTHDTPTKWRPINKTQLAGHPRVRQAVDDLNLPQQICPALEDSMYCFAVIGDMTDDTIYTDLCGQFPVQSY